MQVISDPMIAQQGINTRHHLPTILLVVQVYNPNILLIFHNLHPPQHSQQSQSTAGSSTPKLMINNPQQFQQGHQRQSTPLVQQQVNQQVRPSVSQKFNPQFNQYTAPHASHKPFVCTTTI